MKETKGQLDIYNILGGLVNRNVDKLIKGLFNVGTNQYNNLLMKTGKAFKEYLVAGANKYGYTKTILYREKPVPINEFFVNMDLECQGNKLGTENINDLLQVNNYITILASGGSGKSTLFKYFFIEAIRNTNLIPIFVELKMINDEEIDLLECIYKSLTNLKFDLEKEYFIHSLNSGRYLILLDGFDEVIEEKRDKLIKEINSLADKYDENHILLSSRRNTTLYNGWSKSIDFRLLSLSKDKALNLISNLKYDTEVKYKFLKDLNEFLFDRHKSFCSNPLLLNLMLLTYEEFAEIPEKVHIFYARAFEVLYARHDASKNFKRELRAGKNLGYDEFVKILEALSILSYLDSKISFDYTTLINYIENSKRMTKIKDFSTEGYITDLVESICLLYLDGLKYTFQHRSFQEFFTARFILNLPDKQQFGVISKLLDKKVSSISNDTVFDLIIEMDRSKFEKVFLIPKLKEIKEYSKGESIQETYINYLSSDFDNYGFNPDLVGREDNIDSIEDSVLISYKSNKDRKHYNDLVNFITKKYNDFYPFTKPKLNYKRLDIIEKYGVKDEFGPEIFVSMGKVKNSQVLTEDFLNHFILYTAEFDYAMDILNKLEQKHKEQDSVLNQLFEIQ